MTRLLRSRNPFIRKGTALLLGYFKKFHLKNKIESHALIANSFPKSGTHLLSQILESLPNVTDYGFFVSSLPSLSFQEQSERRIISKLNYIVPGELSSAHLFYNPLFQRTISNKNILHFFIFRDPRDVVISESYYLTHMNRWHRMHKYFKKMATDDERIMFAISGILDQSIPYDYPNVSKRFERYQGWLDQEDVFSVRFEDLVSENRQVVIHKMMQFYSKSAKDKLDPGILTERAIRNIDPMRSHTFRKGEIGQWRSVFSQKHKNLFKEVSGDLLIHLGYEQNLEW